MEYTNIKKLNDTVYKWMHICVTILKSTRNSKAEFNRMEEIKQLFDIEDFDKLYDGFICELKENIEEYRDIEYVDKYLEGGLEIIQNGVQGYTDDMEGEVIINKYEVKFLLKVVKALQCIYDRIENIYYAPDGYDYSPELIKIYNDTMANIDPQNMYVPDERQEEEEVVETEKFSFDDLKYELEDFKTNKDKADHIRNTLIDFEQWHLSMYPDQYDDSNWGNGKTYDKEPFFKLCMIELKRYEPVVKKELPENSRTIATKKFKWNVTPTDFLELFVALYKSGTIINTNGSTSTRKEFLAYFQELFNLEIKDLEGLLTKATNRKTNRTPFLDNLKIAFNNYSEEKEEKNQKRR